MSVERAHFVGGFGRATWLAPEDVLLPAAAAAVAEAEPSLLGEWQGSRAPALSKAAEHRLARPGAGWRLFAIDPEGCDLRRRGAFARLDFGRLAETADELAAALEALFGAGDAAAGRP